MSVSLKADEDFGLSSDDESAMIALLDDQNQGTKRKSNSNDIPPAKRLATTPIFQYAVCNLRFHFFRLILVTYCSYVNKTANIKYHLDQRIERRLRVQQVPIETGASHRKSC